MHAGFKVCCKVCSKVFCKVLQSVLLSVAKCVVKCKVSCVVECVVKCVTAYGDKDLKERGMRYANVVGLYTRYYVSFDSILCLF